MEKGEQGEDEQEEEVMDDDAFFAQVANPSVERASKKSNSRISIRE